ncbi:proline iminopeptidase, partial [Tanacetum coccineum]
PKAEKTDDEIINAGLLYAHVIINYPFKENWFADDKAIAALKNKDAMVVHGACDAICPIKSAYDLVAAHPHIGLSIARNAGHGVDLNEEYEA